MLKYSRYGSIANKTAHLVSLFAFTSIVTAADQSPLNEEPASNWQFAGALEMELSAGKDYSDNSVSDIALATVALEAQTRINPWVGISMSLLFEEDDTEPHELDTATLTIGNSAESSFAIVAGRAYAPFGAFESFMVSDPLTLELGETRETLLAVNYDEGGVIASVYMYKGDYDETISQFGLSLGYLLEDSGTVLDASLGYISNLADSDAIDSSLNAAPGVIKDDVPGMSAALIYNRGPWVLIMEYVAALSSFADGELSYDSSGAKPTAYNFELAHTFEWSAREYVLAYALQGSNEALDLDLPEHRLLLSLATKVYDDVDLKVEWRQDEDYATSVGGSGNSADMLSVQAAVSF